VSDDTDHGDRGEEFAEPPLTNERRLMQEVDNFYPMILSLLADDADDRGDTDLAAGYRRIRDLRIWPESVRMRRRWRCSTA